MADESTETGTPETPAPEDSDSQLESQPPESQTMSTSAAQQPTGPTLAFSVNRHRAELREATDKQLLLALKSDDESALDEIIERKTGPLVAAVNRILNDVEEARDIVQITFFRLWENRQKFDDRWSPNTWIYRIATNLAIDQLRSRQSKLKNTEPVKLHIQSSFEDRARRDRAKLHEREIMGIFQELATELTEKQRMVFLLREVEGLASKEVSEIVGCRESTVRNHLFNARKLLRRQLIEKYPEYVGGRRQETIR